VKVIIKFFENTSVSIIQPNKTKLLNIVNCYSIFSVVLLSTSLHITYSYIFN